LNGKVNPINPKKLHQLLIKWCISKKFGGSKCKLLAALIMDFEKLCDI